MPRGRNPGLYKPPLKEGKNRVEQPKRLALRLRPKYEGQIVFNPKVTRNYRNNKIRVALPHFQIDMFT